MLHVVSQSPFATDSLSLCVDYTTPGDAVLLTEDAVMAALSGTKWQATLESCGAECFVLQEDLRARGVESRIEPSIKVIDFSGFVLLTEAHSTQMKW